MPYRKTFANSHTSYVINLASGLFSMLLNNARLKVNKKTSYRFQPYSDGGGGGVGGGVAKHFRAI